MNEPTDDDIEAVAQAIEESTTRDDEGFAETLRYLLDYADCERDRPVCKEAARAAIRTDRARQNQWHLIETAPVGVMLLVVDAQSGRVGLGKLVENANINVWWFSPITIENPTHWMPLPDAPE
jgi:hypothetical protein